MPIYEYVCENCGKPFSLFLSYADYDAAVVSCPDCGSGSVRRKIRPIRVATGEKARLQKISEDRGQDTAFAENVQGGLKTAQNSKALCKLRSANFYIVEKSDDSLVLLSSL